MTPGCLVRDRQGRPMRLVSISEGMGAVANIETPDTPGVRINRTLERVPLADLTEVDGPIWLSLPDGSSFEARAITIPLA